MGSITDLFSTGDWVSLLSYFSLPARLIVYELRVRSLHLPYTTYSINVWQIRMGWILTALSIVTYMPPMH